MKLFIATYMTNYGEYVEVIVANNETEAHAFVSDNCREWGYDLQEINIITPGNKLRCGGEG